MQPNFDRNQNKLYAKDVVEVNRMFLSRLLYSNPVCLLSTLPRNIMTISWLTPINNQVCLIIGDFASILTALGFICLFNAQKALFRAVYECGFSVWYDEVGNDEEQLMLIRGM
jgi:hypothetical protein